MSWHSSRDRVAETAVILALVSRTVAKVAGDLVLLAQAEVGEAMPATSGPEILANRDRR